MSALLSRVLTAGLLLAVFVPAAVWAPTWAWGVLMAGVIGMAAFEWARLSHFSLFAARAYAVSLTLAALVLPVLTGAAWPSAQTGLTAFAIVFWIAIAPLWLWRRWAALAAPVRAVTGIVLLLPAWAALMALHVRGPGILLGVMAVVWIADSAAYFVGRRFGRHKLAPTISPGKSWEGVAGALVALMLYGVALNGFAGLPLWPLLPLLAVLLAISVLGDLFESWIKRVSNMKDSGSVLPGHGGVLDRVDALASTLPVAVGMLLWLERHP
jgi:phosphatidate cytidylyltransferase